MTLRYGLIGYGRFGALHARCVVRTAGAELGAVCVRGAESARRVEDDHPGVRIYRDYRELVGDPSLDVVDVVTPNHLHAEMTLAALAAGKHVLVEKPLAITREDCDRIVDAARRSDRQLSVGLELRLSVQWGEIKRLVDAGAIGRPRHAHLSLFRHPYRSGADGWRHDEARVGSWILEEPVHFYDLLLWYLSSLGRPSTVCAWGAAGNGAGLIESFTSTLLFDDGAHAVVTQSLAGFGHDLVLELTGDAGALRSTWSGEDAASATPTYEVRLLRAGCDRPETLALAVPSGEVFELEREIELVTEAFAAGRTLIGAEEARDSVIVCLEAQRAVREGRAVTIEY